MDLRKLKLTDSPSTPTESTITILTFRKGMTDLDAHLQKYPKPAKLSWFTPS